MANTTSNLKHAVSRPKGLKDNRVSVLCLTRLSKLKTDRFGRVPEHATALQNGGSTDNSPFLRFTTRYELPGAPTQPTLLRKTSHGLVPNQNECL